jgi:hypothetical protein
MRQRGAKRLARSKNDLTAAFSSAALHQACADQPAHSHVSGRTLQHSRLRPTSHPRCRALASRLRASPATRYRHLCSPIQGRNTVPPADHHGSRPIAPFTSATHISNSRSLRSIPSMVSVAAQASASATDIPLGARTTMDRRRRSNNRHASASVASLWMAFTTDRYHAFVSASV